jgi:dTMP kinase
MGSRGTLIAIEGIDGAGKHTQAQLLTHWFAARDISCVAFSFPRYESSFGRLIASFLNGEFGKLETVDAHLSALLYAGDRFQAKPELAAALAAGKTILADRYVASNLAHQTARVAPEGRAEFMAWLRQLEYGIYGLPVEDLVIYLRLGASEAQQRVGRKAARSYTPLERDQQESNLTHLEQAAQVYDDLANEPNWVTVECFDAAAAAMRSPEEIHRTVLAAVESRVLSRLAAS